MSNEAEAPAIQRRGLMLVLSSPSGAGKTTLSRAAAGQRFPDPAQRLVHHARQAAGREGRRRLQVHRYGDLPRHDRSRRVPRACRVFDHYYGTPRAPVEAALSAGRDVLFDIDWQGTQQLKEQGPRRPGDGVHPAALDARPGEAAADARPGSPGHRCPAHGQGGRRDEPLRGVRLRRSSTATSRTSLTAVKAILTAERLKRERQLGLSDFVKALREGR